ncbi:uncharacterized protein LOC124156270 [Ischnura elegans]|uniref:uncharacterized protein LOC124156270 n=1 Tax=Ischnura elegans TaxID=197161 RepID=UPI001ED8AE02|nr:uncharacterized protein LOC124156270 [Ischnura elegans]
MSRHSSAPWSLEATTVLIESYSKHDNLYNNKSVHYHNKFLRIKSLHDIVAHVEPYRPGTTTQDIKTKINTLRSQFGVEEQRIRTSLKSGCSPDEMYVPTFRYHEHLLFLREHMTPRKTIDSSFWTSKIMDDNMEESTLVESHAVPAKKLKMDRGDDSASKSEEVQDKVAKPSNSSFAESSSLNLAKFISHGLDGLKNPRRKLLTTKKIFDVLLEAQLEELEDEEKL